ncbi:MAG: ADOP family duplicated permease [Gemmatimonadales bacterium]
MRDQLNAWWKRLRAIGTPERVDREMTDELAFHLEMEVEKNVRAGMTPEAARRAARITFGGVERFKEEVRASRGIGWLDELGRNLRHAGRDLRRAPGFAAVAIATLGLGIGAATTIFSVVDAVVLAPLPFEAPDRLVHVFEVNPEGSDFTASEPNYLDFRDRNRTLAALAAYRTGGGGMSLTGDRGPRLLTVANATYSLFPTLGVDPAMGRVFSADEDRPGGATRVVVMSHSGWQTAFGGDSTIVGRVVTLEGQPFTVLGVMPAEFRFLSVDAWVPLVPDPGHDRDDHWLGMVGRLRPGATIEGAHTDLARIAAENGTTHPAIAGWGVRVIGLDEWAVGPSIRQSSVLLMAAVGILLLLACANVANLLLARATARQTDLSLRLALGASQGRLFRQLLTESGVLALLGAGIGLVAAWWAVEALRTLPPDLVPRLDSVAIDGRALGFAVGAAMLASVGVGLLPAVQAARTDLQSSLKQTGRGGSPRGHHRVREALVVGQVSLAVVLLVGGGLMIRSLIQLQRADTGLTTTNVWTVPLRLSASQYDEEWKMARFFNLLAERIEAIPGVRSAGATIVDPYRGFNLVNDVTPEDRAADFPTTGFLAAAWRIVSPGYFESAGVPLLKGRDFSDEDRSPGVPVAIVSRALAERLWPGQDPIGRRLFWGGTDGTPRTVIGVAGDIRDVAIDADPPPVMFLSTRQMVWPAMTMVVRANGPVPDLAAQVRRAVWAEDPSLPVPTVRPIADSRADLIAGPRFTAAVLSAFAGASLLLAVIGLYGVLAFAVVERTREIGVRIALGARPAVVVATLVRRGLALTAVGLGLGLAVAVGVTRLMAGLLYQTAGTDAVTFLVAPLVLGAVAAVAAYIPAHRASRVDPLTALRSE